MRIRTLDELEEFLDRESAWRKKELSVINLTLAQSSIEQASSFVRVGICMLYAHWEGFIKAAATGYVCYVSTRRPKYRQLSPGFVSLGLRSQIVRAGQSRSASARVDLVSLLLSDLEHRLEIDCEKAIDTQSNLNYDVLSDILRMLGMDEKPYTIKRPLINEKLVRNRNTIAHGRLLEINEQDYQILHSEIIGLIDRFKEDIEDAAERGFYRR